jgi:hypothetical protein
LALAMAMALAVDGRRGAARAASQDLDVPVLSRKICIAGFRF